MLAVLPFANLTGDDTQEYFSDGLTEEMIAQLGRLDPDHLGVMARTSVMHYKHSDEPLDQIGRELGVQYVLEGSFRRDADKVRITAQLIQVKDQTHVWSRQYDRKLSHLLTLQSEIAQETAVEIQRALGEPGKPADGVRLPLFSLQKAMKPLTSILEGATTGIRGRLKAFSRRSNASSNPSRKILPMPVLMPAWPILMP